MVDNLISRKSFIGQFLRYMVTGGFAFVVDFGFFAFFLYVFEWYYLFANMAGLLAGMILNYTISIGWVFSACERSLEKQQIAEFGLFALVGFVGIGFNQLLIYWMVDGLHLDEIVSKVIATAIVLVWNFGGRKLMLFRKKKGE